VCIDDRIEILGLADQHFAPDDRLDSIFGDAVARQDAFPGEAKRDNLAASGIVGLELR
jgi:hypothetical protein